AHYDYPPPAVHRLEPALECGPKQLRSSTMSASAAETEILEPVRVFVGGRWEPAAASRWGDVFNPSSGKPIARVPLCNAEDVDRAVQAAAAALPAWAETPVVERARIMFRFRDLVSQHAEELARLVTREHGKTLSESRASVQRGIEMIEFAC